jgi:CHAT domain
VSAELRITPVLTAPGQMMLMVSGPNMPVRKQLVRAVPVFDDAELESFRRGTITSVKLQELSDKVTEWLFGAELRDVLARALPANAGGLRVVVEVPDDVRPLVWQLPLELVWHDTPERPLLLRKDVQSLVYVVAKARTPGAAEPQNWPFKVLLVRAFPPDLDPVPEVAPLVAKILADGARYGDGMVQVDVLSREAAIGRPATWPAFKERLQEAKNYNMLVFLGHAELAPALAGGDPVAQVFLESEDGNGSRAIDAPQLARLLADCPVDVVVLAGCLTGVEPPGAAVRRRGGAQGVAQTLVNSSEAGVEVAVAMRTELRTTAAVTFLERFFKSLLNPTPDAAGQVSGGNIDWAVRAARRELFLDAVFPPQWAAPVVLRANEHEPYIGYLAQPVQFTISKRMDMLLEVRSTLRTGIADYSFAQGAPEQLQGKMQVLAGIDDTLRAEAAQVGPFIMPQPLTVAPGQAGTVVFELRGALTIATLAGRVAVSGGIPVRALKLAAAAQADFRLLADAQDPSVFELRSKTGVAKLLPAGEVLRADIDVGAAVPFGLYRIAVEIHHLHPPSVLWPGDDIVLVPRP